MVTGFASEARSVRASQPSGSGEQRQMGEAVIIGPFRNRFIRCCLILVVAACDSPEPPPIPEDEPPSYGLIEPEPLLTIEGAPAPGDQRHLRIVGTYRLDDGTTVVANERQLVWYHISENVIPTPARDQASGYRAITWMRGFNGDSLIAYDAVSSKLIVFDALGAVAREFAFETGSPPGMVLPHSILPDGSLLAVAGPSYVQKWRDRWWAVLRLVRVSPEGAEMESLGTALRHPCGPAVGRCAAEFKPYTGTWMAGRRGVYLARPDRAEIRWTNSDSVVDLKGPAGWARTQEGDIPTYSGLLMDPAENLWAQSGDLSRAVVFDSEGRLAGTVEVPSNLQIQQVGLDFVLGIVAAEGTERVQVHQLRRKADLQTEMNGGDYTSHN